MDTRTKIIEAELAKASRRPMTVVTGYFDVLRASHVDALTALARPDRTLLVAVRKTENGVLSARARAELVAALRMVDYVVTADDRELDDLISSLKPAQTVHFEQDDRIRADELKQHVQQRQAC